MIDLIPIGQRVIIKPFVLEKHGSIIIPVDSKEMELTEGEVIAVGNECNVVKKGDIVYYGRYSGFKFERNGIPYRGMNEEDILFLVKPNHNVEQLDLFNKEEE